MIFQQTRIPGAFQITPNVFNDDRGQFVKVFHEQEFRAHGLNFQSREEFFSISNRGVLRGLHFQRPPADHDKLVYCLSGRVLDVFVDLRKGSPTFHQHVAIELDARERTMLYLPSGIAHGFLALEDHSMVMYSVTTVHHPESDAGIRWDSVAFNWPVDQPIVSKRDNAFPTLAEFDSPFRYPA